jgi:CheY-like chemotaxis protein
VATSSRAHVLAIDDDPGTLLVFRSILQSAGFDVSVAESGREGLAMVAQEHPDIVLADLRLPDMSAIDVLRQLHLSNVRPPFVVVTGFGSTAAAVEAMRLGATDFVEKPLVGQELIRVVEQALPVRRLPQAPPAMVDIIPEAHAAMRWVRAIVPALQSPTDPKTIRAWSRCAGVSQGSLKTWCNTAGFSTKRSLDLARLLRAIMRRETHGFRPEDSLDIVDRRTLSGMLKLGGVPSGNPADLPTSINDFLNLQSFVREPNAIRLLRGSLEHLR